jgi:hypothetical protein
MDEWNIGMMGLKDKGIYINLNQMTIIAMPTKIVGAAAFLSFYIPLFHHSIIPMHRHADTVNKFSKFNRL